MQPEASRGGLHVDMMFSAIATGDRVRGMVDRQSGVLHLQSSRRRGRADFPITGLRTLSLALTMTAMPIKSKAIGPLLNGTGEEAAKAAEQGSARSLCGPG